MLISFLRSLILYIVVIFGMRIMGKRQLGQLQPSELVVTILISDSADRKQRRAADFGYRPHPDPDVL